MTYRYVNADLDFRLVNVDNDWRLTDSSVRLPAEYPSVPKPIAARITSFSPTLVSVTNSLKRQVRSRGVQAWQIDLAYGVMPRETFAPLWSFLVSRAGQARTFTVSIPGLSTPRGAATGSPLVKGASQTGTTLLTDGWTNGITALKKGDWFEVDGDRKVYQVTADAVADGSGNATLSLYPPLRRSPPDNVVIHTDVVFTCALAEDSLPADFDQCLHTRGFEVRLVEVLS